MCIRDRCSFLEPASLFSQPCDHEKPCDHDIKINMTVLVKHLVNIQPDNFKPICHKSFHFRSIYHFSFALKQIPAGNCSFESIFLFKVLYGGSLVQSAVTSSITVMCDF